MLKGAQGKVVGQGLSDFPLLCAIIFLLIQELLEIVDGLYY